MNGRRKRVLADSRCLYCIFKSQCLSKLNTIFTGIAEITWGALAWNNRKRMIYCAKSICQNVVKVDVTDALLNFIVLKIICGKTDILKMIVLKS